MYTLHSRLTTKSDQWLAQHTQALISYAETDAAFAQSLAYHVQQLKWKVATPAQSVTTSPFLLPTNRETAVRNTHWLLSTLDGAQGYNTTKNTLATWAQNYESPKDFIIGIVGVAIIGPTLGILKRRKSTNRTSKW